MNMQILYYEPQTNIINDWMMGTLPGSWGMLHSARKITIVVIAMSEGKVNTTKHSSVNNSLNVKL